MTPILEKIQRLRSLATSSNANEAAAAAAAADALIAKHRINEEELVMTDASKKQSPEEDSKPLYETARVTTWKSTLASVLAKHYGCAIWNNIGSTDNGRKLTRYQIVGLKSDMEIVQYMFAWLTAEIERLTKLFCKGKGHVFSASYCEGAVAGIKEQLAASSEAIKNQAKQDGQSTALVRLDDRITDATKALHTIHTNLRTVRTVSYRQKNASAYDQGVRTGRNIQLTKGLNQGSVGLLK